jgi:hypothetical protein
MEAASLSTQSSSTVALVSYLTPQRHSAPPCIAPTRGPSALTIPLRESARACPTYEESLQETSGAVSAAQETRCARRDVRRTRSRSANGEGGQSGPLWAVPEGRTCSRSRVRRSKVRRSK